MIVNTASSSTLLRYDDCVYVTADLSVANIAKSITKSVLYVRSCYQRIQMKQSEEAIGP